MYYIFCNTVFFKLWSFDICYSFITTLVIIFETIPTIPLFYTEHLLCFLTCVWWWVSASYQRKVIVTGLQIKFILSVCPSIACLRINASWFFCSLIQFFTKIKNWMEMASMPNDFKERISRLEHKFAVSTVLFRNFQPIFQEIFSGLTNETIKSMSIKSKKHK